MNDSSPVQDMLFAMQHLAGLPDLTQLPGFEDAGMDTAQAVLGECAKFSEDVLAPLNAVGDRQAAVLQDKQVFTTPGFRAAFHQLAHGGWQGLQHPEALGGQGLPKVLGAACMELINSANLSFALCPLLTDGAIEALLTAGTAQQQALYVPRLIAGEWTGTMNLTEPQAGSDLSLVRTQAQPLGDGVSYQVFGTKIYITYGEHDLAANIIHLVLARLPLAPEGVKGLSLFIVPKFLIEADGSLGARNDVQCVSLEHKLGIKASPTAVMEFGGNMKGHGLSQSGAIGTLLGEPNKGLEAMFIMMNAARFAVGVQGIAVAQRALQRAWAYARERVQSRPVDGSARHAVAIAQHPDVQRMLMTMRAGVEGARALALVAAAHHDVSQRHPDAAVRARHHKLYEFMVPVVKGFSTEMSQNVTSLCIQVHGGMGYIEETGVAQLWRDARILTIYEGTTAIQANDLLSRKTLRDQGECALHLAQQIEETQAKLAALAASGGLGVSAAAAATCKRLKTARLAFEDVVAFMVSTAKDQPHAAFAGAVPYLMLTGQLLAGWQMARALLVAADLLSRGEGDAEWLQTKIKTARFCAEHLLTQLPGWRDAVLEGFDSVSA
jgi:3-(methylthio)propanoyl-CoA dehydrogenase